MGVLGIILILVSFASSSDPDLSFLIFGVICPLTFLNKRTGRFDLFVVSVWFLYVFVDS